jgi:hypothetical protein
MKYTPNSRLYSGCGQLRDRCAQARDGDPTKVEKWVRRQMRWEMGQGRRERETGAPRQRGK